MELLLAAVGGSLLVPLAIAGGCFNSTPAKALKYVDGVDNSKAGQSVATNATNNSAATGNGTATAPGNTENERDASASATPSVAPSTRGAASGGGSALTSSNAVAAPATTNVATADMHAHGAAGAASGGGSALTSSNAVAAPANTNVATAGGGPAALQATSGGASGIHQEIKSIALALSGEANKLILLEPIGQGGFGTVYLGRWRGLEVAVKTVLFSESNQMGTTSKARHAAQPQQRAIMEAAVCTSVMHPNVVSTYHYDLAPIAATKDAGAPSSPSGQAAPSSDWKLYLVQEYCNASLQDAMVTKLLHNKETMQPDMDLVLSILMDIARGLQYIHDKNIIHGDLTPGNVLLKHDSSSVIGVVGKITDFGLCSTIDPTRTHISNITNGTPYYVAPEVVECGMLTKTSDVYSFGVLMWELYRCMPPWVKTESGYQQNKRFRRFPPTSPHVYVALCARCLDKRSKKRPGCTQILAELEVMHAAYLMGYNGLQEPGAASSNPGTPGDTTAPVSPVAPAQLPMGTSELPSLPMPDVPERPLPVQKRGAMAAAPEGGDAPAAPAPPRSTTFVQHFASKSKV